MSESSTKIADLIREGRKIEAIKLLRESTGIGLKQAKEEVERLSKEMSGQASSPAISDAGGPGPSGALSKEVVDLARQGKKIQAIKLLREQTGIGLKEAKEQVEEVTGRGGGCLSVLLLLVMIAVGVVGIIVEQGL
jgi:ribosomal protein L7/L12